jgi:alkylation response protein AidB-like acyl-CoA dehydrogenase
VDGRQAAFTQAFRKKLAGRGWLTMGWPKDFGGAGASYMTQTVYMEEMSAAGAPGAYDQGVWLAGPAIMMHGSSEQQARWLPGMRTADVHWCQLFSEPGAGSDLASLQTRAVRDGDEYVVNGQKVWTTFAHVARYGILLARTDPDAEAHRGISYFVMDMHVPGITIRPIKQMNGASDFNVVFFEDARVPAANLVGELHEGWRLAKVTGGNERESLSGEGALRGQGPTAGTLLDLVREHGRIADPVLRQRLAALYVESEVLRLIRLRTVSAKVQGLEPGPEASVRKALADEHGQHVMAMAVELAGTHGLLADSGPFGSDDAMWPQGYLYSRALTVGGGTSEVQRNILGERVLGLPRD